MNDRIRELATEVGISLDYLTNTKQLVILERFAELIVAECVEVMNQTEQVPVGFTQIKSAAIHSTMLRRHFGIEK